MILSISFFFATSSLSCAPHILLQRLYFAVDLACVVFRALRKQQHQPHLLRDQGFRLRSQLIQRLLQLVLLLCLRLLLFAFLLDRRARRRLLCRLLRLCLKNDDLLRFRLLLVRLPALVVRGDSYPGGRRGEVHLDSLVHDVFGLLQQVLRVLGVLEEDARGPASQRDTRDLALLRQHRFDLLVVPKFLREIHHEDDVAVLVVFGVVVLLGEDVHQFGQSAARAAQVTSWSRASAAR